jgi:hypothetical protein
LAAANVIEKQLENNFPTWTVISRGDDLTDAINQLDVVQVGEPEIVPRSQSPKPDRRLDCRDDGVYMAAPIPGSALKKFDKFIHSKVQPGASVSRIKNGDTIVA